MAINTINMPANLSRSTYGIINEYSTISIEATTPDTFMKKVELLIIYRIAEYIAIYWLPILIPIGLVGNTLSFLVMMKRNNRKMSTCIYMAALSVNDNLMMCSALHYWLMSVMKITEWELNGCGIASFIGFIAVQNSTFQVLAMTIDKYIAIKWPHKAATYSTPKRAKITVVILSFSVVLYNIPHIFTTKLTGDICLGYAVEGVVTKVYSWFTFVINALIPFVSLIYMNYVIIKKVRESHQMFGANEVNKQCECDDRVVQKRQKTMKNTETQLTTMLLLVTTLFLILMIPTYIRFLYTAFTTRDTPIKYASLMFFYHLSHKLFHTNNGINFFLYCISGRKFRNDLKELLCCGKNNFWRLETISENLQTNTTDSTIL